MPATAEPPPPPAYEQAIQRAYDLIQHASPQDTGPAAAALPWLVDGTGNTQPEIAADLRARPPRYDDARRRLSALLAGIHDPARSGDPALARQRLHEVMSMSRYDALHRPPSVIDRFTQWVGDRIASLLRLLFGRRGGAAVPDLWFYAVGIAVVAAIAFILFRAALGRFSQSVRLAPEGPLPTADHFAEADRLAAAGDRTGAIRSLCAGVAATLRGERAWEGSPLTVREIFERAPDFAGLAPLLEPFEAAVYGARQVDAATYERAAQVAARFRPRQAVAA